MLSYTRSLGIEADLRIKDTSRETLDLMLEELKNKFQEWFYIQKKSKNLTKKHKCLKLMQKNL